MIQIAVTELRRLHIRFMDRLMEWYASMVMVGLCISFAAPDRLIVTADVRQLLDTGIPHWGWMLFFGMFGCGRILALIANGTIPVYGPRARALCAVAAVPVWGMISIALLGEIAATGKIPIGIFFYAPLTAMDMVSIYRATFDVGRC